MPDAITPTLAPPIAELKPPPPQEPMSFAEFFDWIGRVEAKVEWVDGRLVDMGRNTIDHGRACVFLTGLLHDFAEHHLLGEVLAESCLMELPSRPSGRWPDIVFISRARLDRLQATHLRGAADVVVEFVSDDSETRDLVDKLAEYDAADIIEYWLIDRRRGEATFYQRGATGRLTKQAIGADCVYRSGALFGFWLDTRWLLSDPLPRSATIRRQLGLG